MFGPRKYDAMAVDLWAAGCVFAEMFELDSRGIENLQEDEEQVADESESESDSDSDSDLDDHGGRRLERPDQQDGPHPPPNPGQ